MLSHSLSNDPGSLSAKEGNNNNYPLNERINKQIVLGEEYLHLKRKLIEVQMGEYSVQYLSVFLFLVSSCEQLLQTGVCKTEETNMVER